jgi:hypothetical protein
MNRFTSSQVYSQLLGLHRKEVSCFEISSLQTSDDSERSALEALCLGNISDDFRQPRHLYSDTYAASVM